MQFQKYGKNPFLHQKKCLKLQKCLKKIGPVLIILIFLYILGHADPQIQSINFDWNRVDPRLNKTLCQNQKGLMDGYYVKLIGPTKAGPYGLVSEKNLSENTPHYLVNGLLPYTKYKLEVYVKNSNGLYNPDLALEIFSQTKPYIPNPPKGKKLALKK